MRDTAADPDWWLANGATLICTAASRFGSPFPYSFTMSLIEFWREMNWPVIHFLPDPQAERSSAFPESGLLQPGALWFESDTHSVWSNARFREFHHDHGEPPVIIVGGELDRSMIAIAVGAAERHVPAIFMPDTAGCSYRSPHDETARRAAISTLQQFAVEATPQKILNVIKARRGT